MTQSLKAAAGSMSKKKVLKAVASQDARMATLVQSLHAHTRDTDKTIQYLLAELVKVKPDAVLPEGMQQFIDSLHYSAEQSRRMSKTIQ